MAKMCSRLLLSTCVLSTALYLSGCSGLTNSGSSGSSGSSGNGSGSVSVAIATAPPSSLAAAATAMIAATVTNDSTNAGVNWSCTPAASCGSFNPAHTASGASTTYTAPSAAGSVTIIAASAASTSVTVSANISITASSSGGGASLGAGTYTFVVGGEDAHSRAYGIAGAVVIGATGSVTGGEQDYNSAGGPASLEPAPDSITGGSLTTGSNGQGTLTLVTNNTNVGANGTETFSVSIVNSKHALVGQFDNTATSSGTLDLQTPGPGGLAQIDGSMAIVVSGKDGSVEEVFGGIVSGDGAGAVSVEIDQNEGGAITLGSSGHTNVGTYTAPDASGRGTMIFGGSHFSYYVVTAKVLRLIITDSSVPDVGSAYNGVSSATLGTLATQFVFTDHSNSADPFVAGAGFLTADGNGNVSGFADINENGTATSAAYTGTYTMAGNGYGRITIAPGSTQDVSVLGVYLTDPSINLEDPNNPNGGGGGLLIDLDTKINGSGLLILPPGGSSTLTGAFAWNTQTFSSSKESDGVGYVTISGTNLTGAENVNDLFNAGQDTSVTLSGTLAADPTNVGRFTLPLTIGLGQSPTPTAFAIYRVSSSELIVVDTAGGQLGLGLMLQQQ